MASSSRKILNQGSPAGASQQEAEMDPRSLATALSEIGARLRSEFISEGDGGIDYGAMASGATFQEYQALAARLKVRGGGKLELARWDVVVILADTLKFLDPSVLTVRERKALFINLYNLLTLHVIGRQKATPEKATDIMGNITLF